MNSFILYATVKEREYGRDFFWVEETIDRIYTLYGFIGYRFYKTQTFHHGSVVKHPNLVNSICAVKAFNNREELENDFLLKLCEHGMPQIIHWPTLLSY